MSKEKALIIHTIESTAKAVVLELKSQGMIKEKKQQSPFQKTETLLYNLENFKSAINKKHLQIETLEEEGLPRKSVSVSMYSSQSTFDNRDEEDKLKEQIDKIKESISLTEYVINLIDTALEELKKDQYYKIITLKYFEGKTAEEIAEELDVDPSTISRNKNRLVKAIMIRLFSDEVIFDILN